MLEYPVQFFDSRTRVIQAFDLTSACNLPRAYHTLYAALALKLSCDFWTLDKVLVNSVQDHLPFVRWLGDFHP